MAKVRTFVVVVALGALVAAGLAVSAPPVGADPAPGSTALDALYTDSSVEHTYTVPAGVTEVHVTAIGGRGGHGSAQNLGGRGARVEATLAVTAGQVLYVHVGGVGTNTAPNGSGTATAGGGGAGGVAAPYTVCGPPLPQGGQECGTTTGVGGASGGGASDVRSCSDGPSATCADAPSSIGSRLVVAGGGGGAASGDNTVTPFIPGGAGGDAGAVGGSKANGGQGGGAGTNGAPGAGGAGELAGLAGTAGTAADGGTGANPSQIGGAGGGGGGGFQGGGGGGAGQGDDGDTTDTGGGGGGGGGSYARPDRTSDVSTTLESLGGAAPSVRIQAPAPTITVNSTGDDTTAGDGDCTLREALGNFSGSDTTDGDCAPGFSGSPVQITATGVITVGSVLPDLPDGTDLSGPGAASLTIQPAPGAQAGEWRLLTAVGTSTISGVTFAGSSAAGDVVGGLLNRGSVTLDDCTFRDLHAYYGGAIESNGDLVIERCQFLHNRADGTGGAIQHNSLSEDHSVVVRDSTFSGNASVYEGGALWLGTTGAGSVTTAIERSTLESNSSFLGGGGGAAWVGTTFSSTGSVDTVIRDSVLRSNSAQNGAGIFQTTEDVATGAARLLIDRSEMTDNATGGGAAGEGGALFNLARSSTAVVDIVNSTVQGNQARHRGAGILNASSGGTAMTTILHSSVYANSLTSSPEGGIVTYADAGPALVRIGGSIIGHNGQPGFGLEQQQVMVIGPPGTANGQAEFFAPNLFTNVGIGEVVGANDLVVDVPFRSLANNGGPTRSALPNAYDHLDRASDASCLDPRVGGVDQRGVARPQGDACDIGPLEVASASPVLSTPTTGFTVGGGTSQSVVFRAFGLPAPTVVVAGTLPAGLTRTTNADGSVTISGDPAVGTGGSYHLVVSASNGVAPDALQGHDLVVLEPQQITSPSTATFRYGRSQAFTLTTSGYPSVAQLRIFSCSGGICGDPVLPPGLTFADQGHGTALISGTPASGAVGTYAYHVVAVDQGSGFLTDQDLTIVVEPKPVTVTPDPKTVVYGTPPALSSSTTGLVAGNGLNTAPTCSVPFGTLPPGQYDITCSGAADPDYVIAYGTAKLTVLQKPVHITAYSYTITYGDPLDLGYDANLVPGDPIDVPPTCTVGTDRPGVGVHVITCSGAADPHYQFNSYDPGQLVVLPKALSIVAHDATRPYGSANPTLGWHLTGFAPWDTQATAGITGAASCTTTATPASPASPPTYPITCSKGTLSAANYTFGGPPVAGKLTIAKANTELTNNPSKRGLLKTELSTRLTRTSDGAPLAGRTVKFTLAGTTICTVTTNADGRATCSYIGLVIGVPTWTTSWTGDTNYNGDSTTSPL